MRTSSIKILQLRMMEDTKYNNQTNYYELEIIT
jgi:hypothetical protein